ncbi:MAG: hypothetical protein JXB38_16335 [Anaerolineales bacterium]|nr:hypothetical protein [Anaerolineales bacterium]
MIKVYVNYPNPHFTIHLDPNCSEFQKNENSGQRVISIRVDNLGDELLKMIKQKYRFAAQKDFNDMWFVISLDSIDQEIALVHIIQLLFGKRYSPLRDAPVKKHCDGDW